MNKPFEAKKLEIEKDLDGMSLKMIQNHFKLYEGYVKKTNEIQEKLKTADKKTANGVYSEYGELKRQETFAVNGMKLHEFYFAALGGDGTPKGELVGMIERDFGYVDAWKEEMVATGLSARGWAVLAYDYGDMKLHIYGGDAHNIGSVWNCAIILPLDVYEHSYFIDYAVDRKAYIESFFKNLNWDFLNGLVNNWSLK